MSLHASTPMHGALMTSMWRAGAMYFSHSDIAVAKACTVCHPRASSGGPAAHCSSLALWMAKQAYTVVLLHACASVSQVSDCPGCRWRKLRPAQHGSGQQCHSAEWDCPGSGARRGTGRDALAAVAPHGGRRDPGGCAAPLAHTPPPHGSSGHSPCEYFAACRLAAGLCCKPR